MNDDRLPLPGHEAAYLTARLKLDHEESNTKVAERLRRIMSTCFDGSRSGDLAFQLADMEEWIPKFTSEWKANHRRWLDLCDRLGFDALDLSQRGRVAEVKQQWDKHNSEASNAMGAALAEAREQLAGAMNLIASMRADMTRVEPSAARAEIQDVLASLSAMKEPPPAGLTLTEAVSWLVQRRDEYKVLFGEGVDETRACRAHLAARHAEIDETREILTPTLVNGVLRAHLAPKRSVRALSMGALAREVVAQAERWRIDAEHYRSEASNATAKQVESLSVEVARLTGEVAATRAEAKRQIDAAIDRSQEAEKALMVVGWPGGDPIKWAHKVREDATPSSLTVAIYEAEVSDLVRQLLRKCASHNDLVKEIGRNDQAMRDLSRQFMEYSQMVDRYKMAMVKLGSATEIAEALEWAATIVPSTAADRPQVRCSGYVTVRINKDRVIVKGQTWTSDDPNFKAWDVSLHDDDPRFGFGAPLQQRSHVGPTMELGERTGTWTWRGSMGGFGDIKWQGTWTTEPTRDTTAEMPEVLRG